MGLKHICVAATTVALASSSSTAATKLDGAAFLETFDDGLKGWVKSEVEQYTGTFVRSLNFFFSRRVANNAIGGRRGRFFSRQSSCSSSSSSRTREGRECANFIRSGKKRDLAGKKINQSRQSAGVSFLRIFRESSREDATKMRRRRERAFFGGGSLCAARELVYRAVSLSLSLTVHSHVCFSLFSVFFSLLQAWLNSRTKTGRKP